MSRLRNITTALAAVLLTAPAFAYDIQMPGNDTKLSIYGFVYALANENLVGATQTGTSDLIYQGAAGGLSTSSNFTDNAKAPNNFLMNTSPSRYGFASTTPTAAFGDITTKIEMDLNGLNQSSGNFHLRHAYATVGNFLFGQTFSVWDDLAAYPETINWQGAIGNPGFDTPRRYQMRYTIPFDKHNELKISIEKNQGLDGDTYTAAGTAAAPNPTATTPAAVMNTKIPALVAAYTYSDSWGHIAAHGMAVQHGEYIPATAGVASYGFTKESYAGLVSGDVKFGKDDFVFNVYTGQAIDDWGVGIQGAVFTNTVARPQAIDFYTSTGWSVGYTHVFTPVWRANIYTSGVKFKSNDNIATTTSGTGTDIKQFLDGGVNVFYTLTKSAQFGLEYYYETGKTFGARSVMEQNGYTSDEARNGRIQFLLQVNF
jgi:hypothetical protein